MAGKIENNKPVDPNARDVQIKTKLIALIGGVIVLSSFIVATLSLTVFDKKQVQATEVQLLHSADGAMHVMNDWIDSLKNCAAITANRSDIANAYATENTDFFNELVDTYTELLDYDFMAFVDSNGIVTLGGKDGFEKGKNISSSYAVSKALSGSPAYSFEEIPGYPYSAIYAYPVKVDGRVVSVAVFAYSLATTDFLNLMQVSYDVECTIFSNDIRVKSTIPGVEGTPLANNEISDKVLVKGENYKGRNKIKGKDYISVYSPLKNDDGKITGILFIAKSLEDVEAIKFMTIKIVVPIALAIAIGLMFLSYLFIRWLMWRIANVTRQLKEMATGEADLTKRVTLRVLDEIGDLVINFNAFCDKLQQIIGETKKSKNELSNSGESMSASTQETASSITQIISNIESISHQINTQSGSVQQTAGAVDEISANIESLNQMIEHQSSGVSQASAAVEQMIGNISSVNNSVEKMASSFEELQSNANTGFKMQNDVNERILQIETQSEMLQDANTAISSIAEQTNLLAMNAAIEAAHAGEAGKGFAVVADEIRKLSETSTAQSKTIGNQLKNIKDSINKVVSASSESTVAFETVSRKLEETDALVIQIKAAMEEQNAGSKQITDALHSMNDSTVEVRNASKEMQAGNEMILHEVKQLQNSTMQMTQSMDEMSIGAQKINETGAALTEVSDQIKDSINKIGIQVDQFKV